MANGTIYTYRARIESTGTKTAPIELSITGTGEIDAIKRIYSQNAKVTWTGEVSLEGWTSRWSVSLKSQIIATVTLR